MAEGLAGHEAQDASASRRQVFVHTALDLLCLAAFPLLAGPLSRLISEPQPLSIALPLALYLTLSFSMQRVIAGHSSELRGRLTGGGGIANFLLFCAFGFGIFMVVMPLDIAAGSPALLSWLDFDMNSALAPWLSLLAGILLLALVLALPAALLGQNAESPARPAPLPVLLIMQLSSSALAQFTGIYITGVFAGEADGLSIGGRVLLSACVLTLLVLFMAAPRLIIATAGGGRLSLGLALLSLALYASSMLG